MSDKSKRVREFQKNELHEKYNQKLNTKLAETDSELLRELKGDSHTPIFVVGCQRSGTTLLNQLIINNFNVAYPTNFIARFWNAPSLGCLLQKNMGLDFGDVPYKSELGYTPGLTGPHEFNYFWSKWFRSEPYEQNGTNYLSATDKEAFKAQIDGMSKFTGCSWVFKNLHRVPFQIELLHELFPNALFIHIKRDIYSNVESTLKARKKLFGDETVWLGPKPSNYLNFNNVKPINSVLKQIESINTEVENGLNRISKSSYYKVNFEKLVAEPQKILNEISLKMSNQIRFDRNQQYNTKGVTCDFLHSTSAEFRKKVDALICNREI